MSGMLRGAGIFRCASHNAPANDPPRLFEGKDQKNASNLGASRTDL
jgi:hypothetical protein